MMKLIYSILILNQLNIESEFVQSEVHLNGEAYSILTSDCLNFYLVQVN